ncbi:protein SDA1 homolog [Caerostris darwini]|uniref:Protein SDA1 n=1 Tax=Caerostris darwini TaxID=1538125 RepID=A0AAV4X7D2_9ARAC|nr:protein SDA1 homolog [Caerostris darwini]
MRETTTVKFSYTLLQLQNYIKRDPESYYEEFQIQHEHFKAMLKLLNLNAQEYQEDFADMVNFLAQVSSCYKEDLKDFPEILMNMLKENGVILNPSLRHCLVKALILMRNRGILLPTDLITLFFELLHVKDKILRDLIQIHIISDLKKINAVHKNVKVNTTLQNFMFKMLTNEHKAAPRVSLDIMVDLYRRNIWRDAKTVNAIASACVHKDVKLLVKGHKFFLNIDEEDGEKESSSEDDGPTVKEVMSAHKINKKTRKRKKILEKTKHVLKKSKKRKKNQETINFAAIHLIHDPLGLAEKLFARLQIINAYFEVKLLMFNFISRLIGIHQLILLNFYSFLRKFIKPHQREVTKILVCAAQAVHEYVPPDIIQEIIKEILDNFVTERNSNEVITVGINAIREICSRCPLAIDADLLHDLAQYDKYKDKNVTMAAKSLIKLYREINPKLLQRKYRGRPTEASKQLKNYEYGASKAQSYVPGTEILSVDPSDDKPVENDEANDSDGSWINVSHSEDEVDEKIVRRKKRKHMIVKIKLVKMKMAVKTEKSSTRKNSEKKNEEKTETDKENKEKAETISYSRILTQEEFQKIKVAQLQSQVQYAKGKKRKSDALLNEAEIKKSEVVSLKDIEKLHKKLKTDKESRLATAQEGREGREKFGKKKKTKNPYASKTQKQQNKNKAFMMIKHKVRSKIKRSFRDKQVALKNALLKRRKKY